MRSASCEFIQDNNNNTSNNGRVLNKLNETLDEDDESINDASSSHTHPLDNIAEEQDTSKRSRRVLGLSSFNTSQSSQISSMSKFDRLNKNPDTISNSSRDVKSVKFKEPDCYQTTPDSPGKKTDNLKNQEQKLIQSLDKALGSTPANLAEDKGKQKIKSPFGIMGGSSTSVDKPPKGPAVGATSTSNLTNAFGLRSKISGLRSRTLDAYDSVHKTREPAAEEACEGGLKL